MTNKKKYDVDIVCVECYENEHPRVAIKRVVLKWLNSHTELKGISWQYFHGSCHLVAFTWEVTDE